MIAPTPTPPARLPPGPTVAHPSSLRWPANRFYWAVIDGMGWSKAGPLPPGLLATLADELPLPVQDVHAVCIPLIGGEGTEKDGRLLICACPRAALSSLDAHVVELKPESIPIELASATESSDALAAFAGGIALSDLDLPNLLSGEFEPAPLRAARRSRQRHLATTALLCALAVSLGFLRRATHDGAAAEQVAEASSLLLTDLTGSAPSADPSRDHREENLRTQAQALQAVVTLSNHTKVPTDASLGLESLLKAWPTEIGAVPQSVLVAADGISLGVVLQGDPASFLHAFKPPARYMLDEPRVSAAGPVTRLSLHLRPSATGSGPESHTTVTSPRSGNAGGAHP